MLNRIVFPIVIVMSACSLITASAQSQGIIGPVSTTLALGVVLDQVEEKIDGIIRTAGKEARATIMEASRQMRLVTTYMRIAFADSS